MDKPEKEEYAPGYFNVPYDKLTLGDFERLITLKWGTPLHRMYIEQFYQEYVKIPEIDADEFIETLNLNSEGS